MKSPLLLLMAVFFSSQIYADEGELTMAFGIFDVAKSEKAMWQLEYRLPRDWSGFKPKAGIFFTPDSTAYLYAGVGYPYSINERWSLTPSLSAGYYHKGAGKNLGHDLEFYSQLRLEHKLESNARVGLGMGHISNAGTGGSNPGSETLYLSYSKAF